LERLDVAKLAAELDQMRAKDAIVALLYDYCHELDYLRPSEVVALFTPDAELDIRMDNAVVAEGTSYDRGVVHRGQDQINAFYRAITVRDSSYPAPYHHLVITRAWSSLGIRRPPKARWSSSTTILPTSALTS